MSIDSNTSTNSTDLNNNDDSGPLIFSDVIVNSSELTEKQHRVLLSASAFYGKSDVSFHAIARNAGVCYSYVRMVLVKYIDRQMLPSDCRLMERCTATKTYDDLTDLQRQIVNELVINEDQSDNDVAEIVDCSSSHVQHTRVLYDDIIQSRREAVCE